MSESPYREAPPFPSPPPPDPYLVVWRAHRRHHRARWFVWLGCLATMIALIVFAGGPLLGLFLPMLAWGTVLVDLFYLCQGDCPRCGKPFHTYRAGKSTRCRHCGLPFGTLKRDALPAEETRQPPALGEDALLAPGELLSAPEEPASLKR